MYGTSTGSSTHVDNINYNCRSKRRCDLFWFLYIKEVDVVNVTNSNTQLQNVKDFFDTIRSSSYASF